MTPVGAAQLFPGARLPVPAVPGARLPRPGSAQSSAPRPHSARCSAPRPGSAWSSAPGARLPVPAVTAPCESGAESPVLSSLAVLKLTSGFWGLASWFLNSRGWQPCVCWLSVRMTNYKKACLDFCSIHHLFQKTQQHVFRQIQTW